MTINIKIDNNMFIVKEGHITKPKKLDDDETFESIKDFISNFFIDEDKNMQTFDELSTGDTIIKLAGSNRLLIDVLKVSSITRYVITRSVDREEKCTICGGNTYLVSPYNTFECILPSCKCLFIEDGDGKLMPIQGSAFAYITGILKDIDNKDIE